MTKQELREEIKMLHFPEVPEERLPNALLDSQIVKAYKRAVTMGMVYPQNTDITLADGTYDLAGISTFYEPRWYEKANGDKLRKIQYENIRSVPVVSSDTLTLYYQVDKNFYLINGDAEVITVHYWSYPPPITNDTTALILPDEFSGVIVSRVAWIIAQGANPKMVSGYIASYNEEFKVMKQHFIKKHQTARGHVVPMDY